MVDWCCQFFVHQHHMKNNTSYRLNKHENRLIMCYLTRIIIQTVCCDRSFPSLWNAIYDEIPVNILEQTPVRGSNFLVGAGTEEDSGNHWEMSKGSALPNIPIWLEKWRKEATDGRKKGLKERRNEGRKKERKDGRKEGREEGREVEGGRRR